MLLLTFLLSGNNYVHAQNENDQSHNVPIQSEVKSNKDFSQWSLSETQFNFKNNIELLVFKGELTKRQADSFLSRVENAKTSDEVNANWQEVEQQVKTNQDLPKWSLSEAQINFKNNIELLVSKRRINKAAS